MIRSLLGITTVLFLVGATARAAQPAVAVVNIPAVSEQYRKTADLEAHFDGVRQKLNEEREALRAKIDRTARSLQEEFKPGTDDYRQRRKQLAMLEAELQYFVESEGQRIEAGLARSLRMIFDDIHKVVGEVARDEGIDIVLAADQMPTEAADSPTPVRQQILLQKVLYWSPEVDLTDEVVARLNARYEAQGGKSSIGAMIPQGGNVAPARGGE